MVQRLDHGSWSVDNCLYCLLHKFEKTSPNCCHLQSKHKKTFRKPMSLGSVPWVPASYPTASCFDKQSWAGGWRQSRVVCPSKASSQMRTHNWGLPATTAEVELSLRVSHLHRQCIVTAFTWLQAFILLGTYTERYSQQYQKSFRWYYGCHHSGPWDRLAGSFTSALLALLPTLQAGFIAVRSDSIDQIQRYDIIEELSWLSARNEIVVGVRDRTVQAGRKNDCVSHVNETVSTALELKSMKANRSLTEQITLQKQLKATLVFARTNFLSMGTYRKWGCFYHK